MSHITIIRLVVSLTCCLIICFVYTKLLDTHAEFTDYELHYDLNGDAKKDDANISRAFDYNGPCDIAKVITSLYDVSRPLTSSVLDQIRGCLVLLFFRSPRCGTTAIYYLLTKLSRNLIYNSVFDCHIHKKENWVRYIDNLTITRTPTAVTVHRAAIDIIKDPKKSPVIMNIIRHPVDHIASIFKMKKYGDRKESLPPGTEVKVYDKCNMTLSEYVLDHGLSQPCIFTKYLALGFLCGECDGCDSKPVCLQKAKTNLDTLYLAVGTTENIPGFLIVMETLLPQFFHDALKEYVNMSGLYSLFSADARNATLTPEAVDYLNKELAEDIEIYHYVQQRSFIAIKKVLEYRANNALEDNAYLRNREQCLVDKTCI